MNLHSNTLNKPYIRQSKKKNFRNHQFYSVTTKGRFIFFYHVSTFHFWSLRKIYGGQFFVKKMVSDMCIHIFFFFLILLLKNKEFFLNFFCQWAFCKFSLQNPVGSHNFFYKTQLKKKVKIFSCFFYGIVERI